MKEFAEQQVSLPAQQSGKDVKSKEEASERRKESEQATHPEDGRRSGKNDTHHTVKKT